MQTHSTRRSIYSKWFWLMIVFILALGTAALYSDRLMGIGTKSTTTSPDDSRELFQEITFGRSITNVDVEYLESSLQWLRHSLPEWYEYIADTKPLILSVDLAQSERGRMATAQCCTADGFGMITFAEHFRDLTASDEPEDRTSQARQIEFLSTLIHEVAHIRDRREGRIPNQIDAMACVASERSAYAKELNFKRAVAHTSLNSKIYRIDASRQVQIAVGEFNREPWRLPCVMFNFNAGFPQY